MRPLERLSLGSEFAFGLCLALVPAKHSSNIAVGFVAQRRRVTAACKTHVGVRKPGLLTKMGSFGKKFGEPDQLFRLEADRDLTPEIRKDDLLLVERSVGKKLPCGEGLYVLSVPMGLAVRRVQVVGAGAKLTQVAD